MFEPLPDPQPQPSSSGYGGSSLDPGKIIETDKIILNSLKPGNFVLVSCSLVKFSQRCSLSRNGFEH